MSCYVLVKCGMFGEAESVEDNFGLKYLIQKWVTSFRM